MELIGIKERSEDTLPGVLDPGEFWVETQLIGVIGAVGVPEASPCNRFGSVLQ